MFEKKKGQRKESLAALIKGKYLEPFVSGTSLGASRDVDAPQVNVQYAIIENLEHNQELVEKMYFDRLADFVYVELMKGLRKGFVPKRCANCGRWFSQMPGVTYNYCSKIAPGEETKTCRDIGTAASFQEKVKNNDIWSVHQRTYKKYFARAKKGTMEKSNFEAWSRDAEVLRDKDLEQYENARTASDKATVAAELKQRLNQS